MPETSCLNCDPQFFGSDTSPSFITYPRIKFRTQNRISRKLSATRQSCENSSYEAVIKIISSGTIKS